MSENKSLILNDFKLLLTRLKSLTVTKAWRGFGTTIFIEFGDLDESSRGELTVTIEGSWQLKEGGKVLVSSDRSSWEKIDTIISGITNNRLTEMVRQNSTYFRLCARAACDEKSDVEFMAERISYAASALLGYWVPVLATNLLSYREAQ